MVALSPLAGAGWQFFDNNGVPLAGGKLYTYAAGTTTPAATYTSSSGATPHANPIILDSAGRVSSEVWLTSSASYKFTLATSADVTLWTKDDIDGIATAAFIASLASSTGASLVGFSQSATYPSGTIGKKLQQFICPLDAPYSAAGDGSTDDTAAVLAALQSGYPVDLAGRTYSVDTLTPSSFKGLRNGTLKWRAPVQQAALLAIVGISNASIGPDLKLDIGSTTNTGSVADSNRQGLKITSSNPGVTYVTGWKGYGVEVFGDGNGSRIQIRSVKDSQFDMLCARDGTVSYSPDPSNDAMNGIDLKWCSNVQLLGPKVYNLNTVVSSVAIHKNTRGILVAECQDILIADSQIQYVGQGIDCSGGITASDPYGNRNINIIGGSINDCYTFGVKLANVTRNSLVAGVEVTRPGFIGVVCSGSSVALTDKTLNTSFIDVIGCMVTDPTGSGGVYASPQAFRVMQSTDTGWPRGIRFIDCIARDSQGTPKMYNGFASDVTYDGTSKALNEVINCRSYGQTSAGFNGFGSWNVILTGSTTQSINSGSQTDLTWDIETLDSSGAHSGSSSDVTIQRAGWYCISFSLAFASNSTGYRSGIILQNGSVIPGGTVTLAAVTGSASVVQGSTLRQCAVGDVIKVAALQNSGGALNVDKAASQFALQLVEPGE